jgi:cytidine deaminase
LGRMTATSNAGEALDAAAAGAAGTVWPAWDWAPQGGTAVAITNVTAMHVKRWRPRCEFMPFPPCSARRISMRMGDAFASRLTAYDASMSMTNAPLAALKSLYEDARQAARNSYSPYSGFKVGAALRLSSGEIVTGTNVENVSYGLTICAERSALVRAVAEHGPDIRIAAVAVANLNDAPSPPCGACRQVLAEFILPDARVAFPAVGGLRVMAFSEILPLAFDMKLK